MIDDQDACFRAFDALSDALTLVRGVFPANDPPASLVAAHALREAMWREFQERYWVFDYHRKKGGR